MSKDHLNDVGLRCLKQSVTLLALFEEAMIEVLAEAASKAEQSGTHGEALPFQDLVRQHRDGLIQHRAVMTAAGLD